MASWRRITALGAAGILVVTACGGGDDADEDVVPVDEPAAEEPAADEPADESADEPVDDSTDSDDGDAGSGEGGSDGSTGGDASTSDLPSVWPLPDASSIEEFIPYSEVDNEFVTTLQGSWFLAGTDVETVIAFYEELLPSMGYEVGPRIPLGESIAINVTDPDDANVAAVVQAGLDPDGAVVLNQEKTTNKTLEDSAPPTTTEPPAAVAGDASIGGDEPAAALDTSSDQVAVDWTALPSTPFYATAGPGADPLFHIHTNPGQDGFFLSFEMYTEWGAGWTGDTGTFEISCADPGSDTGICPYFDPDGPGPEGVLGGDFATTGSITINRLDEGGYDIVVNELVFSDGTSFAPFTMTG